MSDLECPYCGKDCDVCHDDGFGYEENKKHQMKCPHCGKSFVFETSISFYYEPEKADCLNGYEHKWKPSGTFPQKFSFMYCKMCGKEREPTEKEMTAIMSS